MPGQRDGLFKATLSRNGGPLGRVPYYGFTANVRGLFVFILSLRLIAFPVHSGRREERSLVGQLSMSP